MSRKLSSRSSVENLKTEAKRWLRALRANDLDARTRFRRAIPFPSDQPTLREPISKHSTGQGSPPWIRRR